MNGDFTLAVHALVLLNHKQTTVSSEELADNICTHPVRVRKIMVKLGRAGLVETKEGRAAGGYHFTKNADEVPLRLVAEAVQTDFVSSDWRSGSIDKPCLIASGMASIMDGIYSDLNTICYERLEQTTLADIDRSIFEVRDKK